MLNHNIIGCIYKKCHQNKFNDVLNDIKRIEFWSDIRRRYEILVTDCLICYHSTICINSSLTYDYYCLMFDNETRNIIIKKKYVEPYCFKNVFIEAIPYSKSHTTYIKVNYTMEGATKDKNIIKKKNILYHYRKHIDGNIQTFKYDHSYHVDYLSKVLN